MTVYRGPVFQVVLLAVAIWAVAYTSAALGPLQEALRASFSLSDNEVAVLRGMALALPVALTSIPMGILVDRTSRKRILVFSLMLALFATVLSALASNYTLLLVARSLSGIAVPGIIAATYSMAADLFDREQRGRATMAVAIGEVTGAPAAFALGGMLLVLAGSAEVASFPGHELDDWRRALLWMTGPLVPALLLALSLREPQRREQTIGKPPLSFVWPLLWRYRAVAMPLQLARASLFIADGAVLVWGAPLLSRSHHLSPDRIGAIMGSVLLIGGLLGPMVGGLLVDFCQRHGGPRHAMRTLALIGMLSVPTASFALTSNVTWVGVLMCVFLILGNTISVAALALSLNVLPSELRGLNVGISMVVASLFFVGLAPLAVSGLSSLLGGEAEIGRALAIVCATASLLNAAVLALGARFFPDNREHRCGH